MKIKNDILTYNQKDKAFQKLNKQVIKALRPIKEENNIERLTEVSWKNLDPWETCKQDNYCARSCHEEGGCANGCPVPRLYRKLAEYEDTGLTPEEIKAFTKDLL